ncbi:MAG TPA: hypothetical protein VHD15_10000 [Hyphomicrobiales bacterium]|nr:hypothetical protein [Hyphomicrobiales bacterium]
MAGTVFVRVISILLGYLVAVVGAVSVVVVAEWIRAYPPVAGDPGLVVATAAAVIVDGADLFGAIGRAALVPAAVAIVLSEIFGWRTWLADIALALAVTGALARLLDHAANPALPHPVAAIAAGAVAGLAYWLLAGRGAGRWRRSRAVTVPPVLPPPLPPRPER